MAPGLLFHPRRFPYIRACHCTYFQPSGSGVSSASSAQGEARSLKVSNQTLAGRVIIFWQDGARGEVLKSFARSELIKLQRGFFIIDSVVAAAPLLGLLGTVAGLATLFPEQGLPDSQTLTRGVGLALSTTMIGLCIAIPALVGSNWLSRRVEILSSQVDVLVESLEQQSK